jgi:hypothetical protein
MALDEVAGAVLVAAEALAVAVFLAVFAGGGDPQPVTLAASITPADAKADNKVVDEMSRAVRS